MATDATASATFSSNLHSNEIHYSDEEDDVIYDFDPCRVESGPDDETFNQSKNVGAVFHTQWGAPVLLYRNPESYTTQDVVVPRIKKNNRDEVPSIFYRRLRMQARWYYPIDQHIHEAAGVMEELEKEAAKHQTKSQRRLEQKIYEVLSNYAPQLFEEEEAEDGDEKEEDMPSHAVWILRDPESYEDDDMDGLASILSHFLEGDLEAAEQIVQEVEPYARRAIKKSRSKRGYQRAAEADAMELMYDLACEEATKQPPDGHPSSSLHPMDRKDEEEGQESHLYKAALVHGKIYRRRAQNSILLNEDYQKQQLFDIQQNARVRILSELDNKNNVASTTTFKESVRLAKLIARTVQKFELTYMPPKLRRMKSSSKNSSYRQSLTEAQKERAKQAIKQRLVCADPAYLAAPAWSSLEEATKVVADNSIDDYDEHSPPPRRKRQRIQSIKTTPLLPDSAIPPQAVEDALTHRVGNCIACFPCFCSVCHEAGLAEGEIQSQGNWFLIHPVGPLMNRLRLSRIQLPKTQRHPTPQIPMLYQFDNMMTEIDIGDRLWQLCRCGADTYVARTAMDCTVIQVASKRCGQDPSVIAQMHGQCRGCFFSLNVLHKIKCFLPSPSLITGDAARLTPRFVAAHPRYGGRFTDSKLAIVMASGKDDDSGHCNVIKHANVGSTSIRMTDHYINNLQDIRQIDFSKQHPMVLWGVARSYIRPTPVLDSQHDTPMLGHGYSLYSIDLRSSNNQATFQWSPSVHQHLVEGVHSISTVATNWNSSHEHSVLVSSISAQKTWELDSRMPCQVVNTWSLPHSCDGPGTKKPHSSVHGTGFLLSVPPSPPHALNFGASGPHKRQEVLLGVNCTPGSFGLHVYRKPLVRPQFHTDSLESANWPGNKETSIASSSCFPLPDVGEKVFTCGLDSFITSPHMFDSTPLSSGQSQPASVLGIVTATNNGDIYVHNLLESEQPIFSSTLSTDGFPVGTSTFPVLQPKTSTVASSTPAGVIGKNDLELRLSNEFPVPSSSIVKTYETRVTAARKTGESHGQKFVGRSGRWNHANEEVVAVTHLGPPPPFGLKKSDETEEPLVIPKKMVDAVQSEHLSTLECFDTSPPSNSTTVSNNGTTSDVTSEVLSKLQDSWV